MLSMEFCSCKIIKVICLYSCLWSSNQPNWQRDPVRAQRTGDETFPTLVFVGFVFLFFSTSDSLSQVHKFSLLPFQFIKCNILCCFVLFLVFSHSHFDFWLVLFDSLSLGCSNFINSFHALPPYRYCFCFSLLYFPLNFFWFPILLLCCTSFVF